MRPQVMTANGRLVAIARVDGPDRALTPDRTLGAGRGCAPARASSLSEKVVSIEVHDFVPRSDELTNKLLPGVVTRVNLRKRAELRMCAEHEVGRRGGPLLLAGHAITTLVHILVGRGW